MILLWLATMSVLAYRGFTEKGELICTGPGQPFGFFSGPLPGPTSLNRYSFNIFRTSGKEVHEHVLRWERLTQCKVMVLHETKDEWVDGAEYTRLYNQDVLHCKPNARIQFVYRHRMTALFLSTLVFNPVLPLVLYGLNFNLSVFVGASITYAVTMYQIKRSEMMKASYNDLQEMLFFAVSS